MQLIYDGTVFRILAGGAAAAVATLEDYLHMGQCMESGAGPIPGWSSPSSGGATAACPGGSNKGWGFFSFTNTATPAIFRITRVPTSWTGTTPDLLINISESSNFGSGTTIWEAATKCYPTNSAVSSTPTFNTLSTVTASVDTGGTFGGTGGTMRTATIADLDMTGCSAGNMMEIKLNRNAGTYANAIGLFGVAVLTY